MRIRWWQSIRWRLALVIVLITLLATSLLALTFLVLVVHYYNVEQKDQMEPLASDDASKLGASFAHYRTADGPEKHTRAMSLELATNDVLPGLSKQGEEESQYLLIVLDSRQKIVYPRLPAVPLPPPDPKQKPVTKGFPNAQAGLSRNDVQGRVRGKNVRNVAAALRFLDRTQTSLSVGDYQKLNRAIASGLKGEGVTSDFGGGVLAQPFIVKPIYGSRVDDLSKTVGVLIVAPRSVTVQALPTFVLTLNRAVWISSIIIVLVAVLAAVLFSRTITRPLAKMTQATRILAVGDYDVRVATDVPGELGELARTFNEMAVQLKKDVEELRRQEVWRRELIMNITHDLATPLTAIAGLGDSLIDGVNQSREDYEATGRVIVRETLRLRRLVKDLHIMAKVEAGALHPQKQGLRLAPLVDEVLAALVTEFERCQVEPRNAVSYTLPILPADADMLARVFSNLCTNALQHTPAGGCITIEARVQDKVCMIAVTDTGSGIPEDALPRVFERFFRADSARQSSTGGSGLGLAIVRAIVKAHGGSVWAENVVGAGARIVFTLPLLS